MTPLATLLSRTGQICGHEPVLLRCVNVGKETEQGQQPPRAISTYRPLLSVMGSHRDHIPPTGGPASSMLKAWPASPWSMLPFETPPTTASTLLLFWDEQTMAAIL